MASVEEAKHQLEDRTAAVLNALEETGVPTSSIEKLRASLEDDSHAEALKTAQLYTRCYPYMDTDKMIDLLAEAWEALCNRRDIELKDVNNVIDRIRNDPKIQKKDPAGAKLIEQKKLKAKIEQQKAVHQLGLYRIRALKSLYIEDRAKHRRE